MKASKHSKQCSETLIRLTELVLTLNCFSFDDNYYQKINGLAMSSDDEILGGDW